MTEETKPFTVSDRRHFTPEGAVRDETQEPEPEATQAPPNAQEAEPDAAEPSVDFASFILSLGAQAGALLGEEIAGVERAEALREARALIGILEMLKDKTEGRRDAQEDRVMEGLLYELRMAYVNAARGAGA